MKIVIDPGHGGRWRPTPPPGDPGVVYGDKLESYYNFQYALSLKKELEKAGYTVVMTRDHDDYTVPNIERTRSTVSGDLFISIHFDSNIGGKKLIYYAGLRDSEESKRLALSVDKYLGTRDIRSSTSSRFGRLYIDDAKCPAILIEVDRIDNADNSPSAKGSFSEKVLRGINDYLNKPQFDTPFQRVFVIEDGVERQLDIEKMSVVGDKLYIRLK